MKLLVLSAAVAVAGLAGAAAAQPAPPYDDTPMNYPWRNGDIQGPGGPAWGGGAPVQTGYAVPPGGGGYGYGYGYGGQGYWGGGSGYAPAPVAPGGEAVFPLPNNNGGYTVRQKEDGTLAVTRYGPVWTSYVGQNGWAHRRYIHYGLPFSGIWPFN